MAHIVPIVERHGEVQAVPVLIRRIARMDLRQARLRAPSFDKMWRAVEYLLR